MSKMERSILDVWQGSKYVSAFHYKVIHGLLQNSDVFYHKVVHGLQSFAVITDNYFNNIIVITNLIVTK